MPPEKGSPPVQKASSVRDTASPHRRSGAASGEGHGTRPPRANGGAYLLRDTGVRVSQVEDIPHPGERGRLAGPGNEETEHGWISRRVFGDAEAARLVRDRFRAAPASASR